MISLSKCLFVHSFESWMKKIENLKNRSKSKSQSILWTNLLKILNESQSQGLIESMLFQTSAESNTQSQFDICIVSQSLKLVILTLTRDWCYILNFTRETIIRFQHVWEIEFKSIFPTINTNRVYVVFKLIPFRFNDRI